MSLGRRRGQASSYSAGRHRRASLRTLRRAALLRPRPSAARRRHMPRRPCELRRSRARWLAAPRASPCAPRASSRWRRTGAVLRLDRGAQLAQGRLPSLAGRRQLRQASWPFLARLGDRLLDDRVNGVSRVSRVSKSECSQVSIVSTASTVMAVAACSMARSVASSTACSISSLSSPKSSETRATPLRPCIASTRRVRSRVDARSALPSARERRTSMPRRDACCSATGEGEGSSLESARCSHLARGRGVDSGLAELLGIRRVVVAHSGLEQHELALRLLLLPRLLRQSATHVAHERSQRPPLLLRHKEHRCGVLQLRHAARVVGRRVRHYWAVRESRGRPSTRSESRCRRPPAGPSSEAQAQLPSVDVWCARVGGGVVSSVSLRAASLSCSAHSSAVPDPDQVKHVKRARLDFVRTPGGRLKLAASTVAFAVVFQPSCFSPPSCFSRLDPIDEAGSDAAGAIRRGRDLGARELPLALTRQPGLPFCRGAWRLALRFRRARRHGVPERPAHLQPRHPHVGARPCRGGGGPEPTRRARGGRACGVDVRVWGVRLEALPQRLPPLPLRRRHVERRALRRGQRALAARRAHGGGARRDFSFPGREWAPVRVTGTAPGARSAPATVVHAEQGVMYVFGGYDGARSLNGVLHTSTPAPMHLLCASTARPPRPEAGTPPWSTVTRCTPSVARVAAPPSMTCAASPSSAARGSSWMRAPPSRPPAAHTCVSCTAAPSSSSAGAMGGR
eukprot:scaffold100054_cov66-Phaeocystis_antarctica.AAC.3